MSETKENNVILFVDFDGTVTNHDVGDGIFSKFLRNDFQEQGFHEKIIADWKAGIISSEQCLSEECANVIITEEELHNELEKYTLTPGFVAATEYCIENDIPITILSDGLDYYIEYILSKYGINNIPFISNHMYFKNGNMVVEFPFIDMGCGRCGNSKRWHMDMLRKDGDCVVYVGDGYSDRYAIKSADVVFAKHDLAEYCREKNHEFIPFQDFYPILKYLENGNGKI